MGEWESASNSRYHLTSDSLTWDPTTTIYEEQENAMVDYHGSVVRSSDSSARGRLVINVLSSLTTDTVDITDNNFHVILKSHAHISSVEMAGTGDFRMKSKKPIDHVALASRWMMSPEKALQTINVVMQRGVRTCLNPTLSQQVPTNNRHLRYQCLRATLFTDTLIAGTTSKHGNKNSQVYTVDNGWIKAHPMSFIAMEYHPSWWLTA